MLEKLHFLTLCASSSATPFIFPIVFISFEQKGFFFLRTKGILLQNATGMNESVKGTKLQ
jgi:hypothetical protein